MLRDIIQSRNQIEGYQLQLGGIQLDIKKEIWSKCKNSGNYQKLHETGFKVFSQYDEDGIIQYLISNIEIEKKTFIEFGVENYRESNTRFLLLNNNWSGYIMDGSEKNILQVAKEWYYWRYNLNAKSHFITKENINDLLAESGFSKDLGLLSIDIDGNDYWIWEEINNIEPRIVICEYNSLFSYEDAISVPYKKDFYRTNEHYSNLFWGVSLKALCYLANKKGYLFVGCNAGGNNAFFVRKDVIGAIPSVSCEEGYIISQARQSRDIKGRLTYLNNIESIELIKDMEVIDVMNNQTTNIRNCKFYKNKSFMNQ